MGANSPGTGGLDRDMRIKELEEQVAKLKTVNTFSFEETQIGTWVDGKPLYRKMFDFGELPSNSVKKVPLGIDNVGHIHINLGASFYQHRSLSIILGTSQTFVDTTQISRAGTSSDGTVFISTVLSSANEYRAYVCLEYTKTTD